MYNCYLTQDLSIPWMSLQKGKRSSQKFGVINSDVLDVYWIEQRSWTSLSLSEPRRFAAGASLESWGQVLFAGGVRSSDVNLRGQWMTLPEFSLAVDIFSVPSMSRSTYQLSVARQVVAAAVDSKVRTCCPSVCLHLPERG